MNTNVDYQTAKELRDAGFPLGISERNPTALEIIAAMPDETYIMSAGAEWEVWWQITAYQKDFRSDTDPHRAAALAYIAWKKGKE